MSIEIRNNKLLVEFTTKEEREKIIRNNLGLATGKDPIAQEDMEFLNMYINGDIEISDARERVIKNYIKRGEK